MTNLPVLNQNDLSVSYQGRYSRLTPKEYSILETLISEPGKTFSPEEIYRTAWEAEPFDCHLVISVHIRHLRQKIEANPSSPAFIKSLWGKGYRFIPSK
ncbi:MAG: response regulator transcription factor [Solobacterium sp.]|nr:response regulator transcription factor [Solobacterium sp.]